MKSRNKKDIITLLSVTFLVLSTTVFDYMGTTAAKRSVYRKTYSDVGLDNKDRMSLKLVTWVDHSAICSKRCHREVPMNSKIVEKHNLESGKCECFVAVSLNNFTLAPKLVNAFYYYNVELEPTNYALDVDECEFVCVVTDLRVEFCTNTPGSFSCQCIDGYHFNEAQQLCQGLEPVNIISSSESGVWKKEYNALGSWRLYDGRLDTVEMRPNCFHSEGGESINWVGLHLSRSSFISKIEILNRGDLQKYANKVLGANVKVCRDVTMLDCILFAAVQSAPLGGWIELNAPVNGGIFGNTVRIDDTGIINLCEIRVHEN